MTADSPWPAYVAEFHRVRPGVTEDVLARATSNGRNPYQWLAEAVPTESSRGVVLDVACGNGPMRRTLPQARWVGVDRSADELHLAATGSAGLVIQGSATALSVGDRAVDAVVCSMALMVLVPLRAALTEVARVLRPGGVLVALVPARSPLAALDRLRYSRLLFVLRRRRFDYPNEAALEQPVALFATHGLAMQADERRRFVYPAADSDAAATLVRSLYLPGVAASRIDGAERVARSWGHVGLGIPLRRLVLRRDVTA